METKIPIYQPFLGEEERNNVNDCLRTTWISSVGPYIALFENKIKEYVGVKYASTVANGTVALHTALLAAGIGKGDEVITPNFTYVASTNSILMVGANPVFVDICDKTWNINVNLIQEKISSKTKAILVTNVYGFPCNFLELHKICKKNNILLIEDAAESFGAEYFGKKSGSLADISTFSFFGNKTLTTGEGGMVLTNSLKFHNKIDLLKNQGNSPINRYYHEIQGYNYRMTNIQAAIGCAQLDKIDNILKLKKRIDRFYRFELNDVATFQTIENNIESSFWMTALLFEDEKQKINIDKHLEKNNIETRPLFYPIDKLPFYQKAENCYIAKKIYKKGLILPSFPQLTIEQQEYIVKVIKRNA